MNKPTLEERLAGTNASFFLREFSFSRTEFQPAGSSEVELADHIVSFDDVLLLFQFKERETPSDDPAAEERWFENKVAKKAVAQVKDTLRHLAGAPIRLANDRGHVLDLPRGLTGLTVAKVIVYQPGEALPEAARRRKGHISSSAGFIHFFQASDYQGVLHTLVTLPEIVDYLGYRERLIARFPFEARAVSEHAIVGHYVRGDETVAPDEQDATHFRTLENNVDEFDILDLLHIFKERTYSTLRPNVDPPTYYYEVLKELLRLSRGELAAFKLRYKWAWDACGGDVTLPSLFGSPATGRGYVFIPLEPEAAAHSATALQNFTAAAKYVLKADRCLGVTFRRDGSDRLLDWMLIAQPWEPDPEFEERLKKHYPFRDTKTAAVARYTFGGG